MSSLQHERLSVVRSVDVLLRFLSWTPLFSWNEKLNSDVESFFKICRISSHLPRLSSVELERRLAQQPRVLWHCKYATRKTVKGFTFHIFSKCRQVSRSLFSFRWQDDTNWNRLNRSGFWMPDQLLPSRSIQLLDPLLALPCTRAFTVKPWLQSLNALNLRFAYTSSTFLEFSNLRLSKERGLHWGCTGTFTVSQQPFLSILFQQIVC